MADFVLPEHLLHEELGIRNDLHLGRPFFVGDGESVEQAGVFGHVVGRASEVAGDFDDVAGGGLHVHAVAGRPGIAAGGAVDECNDFQDEGLSV